MTYTAQRNAIQSKFATDWSAAFPSVPVVFDNLRADKAAAGYVALHILNGDASLRSMGAQRLIRYPGVISVDIFVPLDKGLKAIDQYADTIEGIFRAQNFSGITCRAAQRRDLGKDENYWRVNLSYPFFRDQLV
jgi:hypothetical protein